MALHRMTFPRSRERGPVEAVLALDISGKLDAFPRSRERGPVEASQSTPCFPGGPPTFRAHVSAAPLKLVSEFLLVHVRMLSALT